MPNTNPNQNKNKKPKYPHRRVYRSFMVKILGKISKKYPWLTYPKFLIKAYSQVNPERSVNPQKNFSELEGIAGYVQKFKDQIILIFDSKGRPDLYIKHQYVGERKDWNHDPAHTVGQIDIIPHMVHEFQNPRTLHKYKQPKEVYNDFVEILQGKNAVSIVDKHLNDTGVGIEDMRKIKSESRNVVRVQRYIEKLLAEFEGRG